MESPAQEFQGSGVAILIGSIQKVGQWLGFREIVWTWMSQVVDHLWGGIQIKSSLIEIHFILLFYIVLGMIIL